MRRSAIACAYKKGLSVEPGWRSAITPSTSAAWLSSPDEPTQASTSPLALSSTTMAPSSTWRPCNSRRCCCRVCTAKRCSGARSVVRMRAGGGAAAALRCASAPAAPHAARCLRWRQQPRRCSAAVANRSSAVAVARGLAPCRLHVPQHAAGALRHLRPALALGARTSAAATAASRSSSPCAALPNSVLAEGIDADQLAPERHQVEVGLQNLVLAPAALQQLGRHGLAELLHHAAPAGRWRRSAVARRAGPPVAW